MVFELVTTRNCNLSCKYCFEGKKYTNNMSVSSIEKIINFIEETKEKKIYYDNKNIEINFNGGETLLNKEFIFEFILKTKGLGYKYTMTTNGILIDQSIIDLLHLYNIPIQISLDGKKESHNLNRKFQNGDGSFDIVLTKLKKINKSLKGNNITIACVVTPETLNNYYDNVKFIFDNKFYNIATTTCSDFNWTEINYNEYKKQLHLITEFYIKKIEEGCYFSFSPFEGLIKNALLGFKKGKCDAIFGQVAILPSGDILPCGVFIGSKNEKQFYIGDIEKGFNYKKIESYSSHQSKIDYSSCKECSLFNRCKNDCMALNNRINNDIHKCDVVTCNINQIQIIEIDYILEHFSLNRNQTFYKIFKDYLPEDYLR